MMTFFEIRLILFIIELFIAILPSINHILSVVSILINTFIHPSSFYKENHVVKVSCMTLENSVLSANK